ncbi:alpha/beta fold hydrolase [Actinosynnema sp. NPDC047251]|uniref:Alpha/beta hydrolase fold containing protein n=1 Tax=Saccharothrix espanaensis (strain ATCC 51144 / DSM 44229 / JCM 9112 / NBRC 15066 / NRRL 15764) TaxID=1179773 RepID=K0JR53_SACES|nr:alpha/beta fold hydrolase [Saccharothrix espanaensis]CCH28246.1 alpha/beta hydrolase fold containing protein [Saccharothrix espanaensis DSM 44229]
MHSQLSPHRAHRVDLPGRYGPVAALRAPAAGVDIGATALLVPGYTGSKEDFAPLLDPIADAGLEVVAIDLPGQYESAGPVAEADYHPGPLGAAVAELVGKLTADGRRVLLLGHSYGGLVCRGAVLAQAPITGLTLLSSGPSELPPGERRLALEQGEPLLREQGVAALYEFTLVRAALNPQWALLPEGLKDFYRSRFGRSTAAGLLGMGDALRTEPDLVAKLARSLRSSGTPCLVVCGELDDAWSAAAQRDMAERLDADFAVLKGVLHSPNTEAPEALLATLLPTWRAWLSA